MTTALPTYSNAEWELVHEIMTRIEAQLPSLQTASAVDLAKVQSLVLRTYEQQNMPVTADMVAQVCKAMVHQVPAKQQTSPALMGRKDGPMARAAAAVSQLQSHHPLSTIDLMHHVQRPLAVAHAKRKKVLRVFFSALIGVPVCVSIGLAFAWSSLSTMAVGGAIALGFVAWLVTLIHIATKDPSLGDEDMEALEHATAQALQSLETDTLEGNEVSHILKESMGFSYSPTLLTDSDREWDTTHRLADADKTIRQAWMAWLQSDAPIRKGDVALLQHAAKSIAEAREVMAIYDPTHGLESQASGRAKALERLQQTPA